MLELQTQKGILQIEKIGDGCKEGQEVWFAYEHHYNSRSSSERWLKCKFIKYCKNNKVLVQRKDCKNPSRVSINQVFQRKLTEAQKKMKKLFEQNRARQISVIYTSPDLTKKQEKKTFKYAEFLANKAEIRTAKKIFEELKLLELADTIDKFVVFRRKDLKALEEKLKLEGAKSNE